jgi:serine/threonine protein kinase
MMTAVVARERSLAGRRLRYDGAEWTLGDKLGSGRFATVYLAERTAILSPTGSGAKAPRLLAVKVTEAASITSWARMQLVREASIWGGLSHPHIVRMVGHIPAATQHVLLLEHAAGGELFDRIIALQYLSEASAARMLTQLLSAVAYLHANGL